eukprot:6180005-Pleurochrysis_carterae.AAC.3
MSRTRERPGGTSDRSIIVQLPLARWFAISARSAAIQSWGSSANACLRVFGSADGAARNAQLVSLPEWPCARGRGRSGYAPSPRWKCSRASRVRVTSSGS